MDNIEVMKIRQASDDIVQLFGSVRARELILLIQHTRSPAYGEEGEFSRMYVKTLPRGIQSDTRALDGGENVVESMPSRGTTLGSAYWRDEEFDQTRYHNNGLNASRSAKPKPLS